MAETITQQSMTEIAKRYGWRYDADKQVLTIDGEEYEVPWTKAGYISPRAELWNVMRDANPHFADDYPKTTGTKSGRRRAPTPMDAAYWVDWSDKDLEKVREAIDGVESERRKMAVAKIKQDMEANGLTIDDLRSE